MPISGISLAISPYSARVNKAIKFYTDNMDNNADKGLMLCIAEGPTGGWPIISGTEQIPLPELTTNQLTNVIGFKRIKQMNFVVSDEAGVLTVGGTNWSKLNAPTQEELFELAYTQNSRWLYIEAELNTNEFPGETYRQLGLYSSLEIDTSAVPDYYNTTVFTPEQILRTGTDPNYEYNGVLEVFQNKYTVNRPLELKEMFTWVLEF